VRQNNSNSLIIALLPAQRKPSPISASGRDEPNCSNPLLSTIGRRQPSFQCILFPNWVSLTATIRADCKCPCNASRKVCHCGELNPNRRKKAALARPAGWPLARRYWVNFRSSMIARWVPGNLRGFKVPRGFLQAGCRRRAAGCVGFEAASIFDAAKVLDALKDRDRGYYDPRDPLHDRAALLGANEALCELHSAVGVPPGHTRRRRPRVDAGSALTIRPPSRSPRPLPPRSRRS
jgi:hypothetical protein